jgi:hypothetical protein
MRAATNSLDQPGQPLAQLPHAIIKERSRMVCSDPRTVIINADSDCGAEASSANFSASQMKNITPSFKKK